MIEINKNVFCLYLTFKGQIKAKDIFIDFDHLRPGDFKISNEISI